MLDCLHYRQAGFLSPEKFKQFELTKRLYSLQLSGFQDVENSFASGITTLDVDAPDERYLLSGCSDGTLFIHDLQNTSDSLHYTIKCICSVPKSSPDAHKRSLVCASWWPSDNGAFLTSGSDKVLKIWDTNTTTVGEKFVSKGRIFNHHCMQVPSQNPLIAVASSVNHIELIDLRTGSAVHELRGHKSSVLAVKWSPSIPNLLASGGLDNMILLWDTRAAKSCLLNLNRNNASSGVSTAHAGAVNGLQFSGDGQLLVSCGTDNRLRLWETLNGHHQMINYGKIPNEWKMNIQMGLSSGSKPEAMFMPCKGSVVMVEVLSGRTVKTLCGHLNSVMCCIYSDSRQELYTGGQDRNILVWTSVQVPDDSVGDKRTRDSVNLRMRDTWSSDDSDSADDDL